MNEEHKRGIIARAFIETGRDGEEGMIRYIDRLERAILTLDRDIRDRKKTLRRADVFEVVRGVLDG